MDGTIERRASGGGVAEVEDAGDATACLGEDEVSCVRFDVEDHVACVESDDCVGVGMEVVHEVCAFCLSVDCCCLFLAADIVQGYEDGGADAEAVLKEGAHDFLDALISVGR